MAAITALLKNSLVSLETGTWEITRRSEQLTTGKKINAPSDDPVGWAIASRSHEKFRSLQSVNSTLNDTAMSVKTANNAMTAIDDLIGVMQAALQTIVKNYPPYPVGSEARRDLLSQFNSIRRQINDLTFPPDFGARKLLGDPGSFAEAGDLEVVIDLNGATQTISSQPVHTGEEGLDIPELPAETASDEQIFAAIANLEDAKTSLRNKQAALSANARQLEPQKGFVTQQADQQLGVAEKFEEADTTELAAEIQSLEIKISLIYEAAGMTISQQTRLASLLK